MHANTIKCRTHADHRLTCEEYNDLHQRAQAACEVCATPERETPSGVLHIDHDRKVGTGAVRGLVCPRCNSLLGRVDAGRALPDLMVRSYLHGAWHKSAPSRRIGGGAHMPIPFRVDDELWDAFGKSCATHGTNRSAALREFMEWHSRHNPNAKRPNRPPEPE